MSNIFGNVFRLASFGESHGRGIGGVIDGCPAGIPLDMDFIQNELNRRRPGQSKLTTSRNEPDSVEFFSGIFEGVTTGTPIAFAVWNAQQRSEDYNAMSELFRPSHADYTYLSKYGIRDNRGGGRSSARETVARVVAGAIAKLALKQLGVEITGYTSQVGSIRADKPYYEYDFSNIEQNPVRCADPEVAEQMAELITQTRAKGDTIGGTVTCIIKGSPVGLGEPVFDKLHASLGAAMLSINAVKGFEYGSGFDVSQFGSELNDVFYTDETGKTRTRSNNSGGIQGGITNGEDIYFKVAFKPVATILMKQQTVDKEGKAVEFKAHGRHDPCVLPRAVPIVEAMAALVVLDQYLINKSRHL
ncbi:MAG: chorismate synthase [Bacteroidales bacterium]|jgi:chorismate synthase|nr:chorismate synthase [Bacteroidales bacterium]MDD3166284.1 chorismate synthase [Bacteroidales bacterium]MDD4771175.1 chorismate synthase [Bacteroidales bacterium]HKL91802.1 chorismate synthase [Bacteroidales bacterium]